MKLLSAKNRREHVWQQLFRRKLLIVTVFMLVVAGGMIATFWITPKYEAAMSILVTRDRIDPKITASDKNSEITQNGISDEEFNSELELFKSIDVVTDVVRNLDLVNDQKPKRDTWLSELRASVKNSVYGSISASSSVTETVNAADRSFNYELEKSVNRVVANLDVVPIKKSRVIKIAYSDTDPIRARKTVEAVYQKFVELHVRLNERTEAAEIFNEQTGKFNQKLNEATRSLKSFDSENGVTGADITTQQGLLLKQLSDAQTQTNATRAEIGETAKKITSLEQKINDEPKQIQTGYVSKYVPALDRLKDELSQLEQQRTQLLQKYQPNSRFVRENQERIDQLKRSLAAETANPPQERSFALNDLRRKLEAELHDAQTTLSALKDREKTVSQQAAKLSGEVAFLNTKSIERTGLERNRNVSEEAFLLYQKKSRENEIGQILNKEQVMNFAVVDPPRTDGQQKNPKPLLNLLVVIGVGLMAAFAGAAVMSKLDRNDLVHDLIVSADDIERRFAMPVLATISHFELDRTGSTGKGARRRFLAPGGTIEMDEQ